MRQRHKPQAAGINHACLANQNAIRVQKIDIAANLAVFIGIQKAVNHRLLFCHHIDQIIGLVRQMQIYSILAKDIEDPE